MNFKTLVVYYIFNYAYCSRGQEFPVTCYLSVASLWPPFLFHNLGLQNFVIIQTGFITILNSQITFVPFNVYVRVHIWPENVCSFLK